MIERPRRADLDVRLRRLNRVLVFAFGLVAVALFYWGVWRAEALAVRSDNPRRVTRELAIERGTIYDRRGTLLAVTEPDEDGLTRRYPLAEAGGPAVGHYSFRHGTAGIEAGADPLLRGERDEFWADYWRETLHRPQVGRDIRLTIDAGWQTEAMGLLAGSRGAAVLLSLPDGAVRLMAGAPSYDPNQLDALFGDLVGDESAPLLNRVTQGQYQPGLLLAPLLATWSAAELGITLDTPLPDANEPLIIDEAVIRCQRSVNAPVTLGAAVAAGCPAAALFLAERLNAAEVTAAWDAYGLTQTPDIAIATETAVPGEIANVTRAILGQEDLLLSPLQVALAWSALAGGRRPQPFLVTEVADEAGVWGEADGPGAGQPAVDGIAAQAMLDQLPRDGDAITYAPLVLSGPGGQINSWFVGLAPAQNPRFIVVVVIEETTERTAPAVGRALLALALSE